MEQNSILRQNVENTINIIRNHTDSKPKIGIILGTGLEGLANEIDIATTISYENLPHFPLSTVEFHSGKLLFGTLSGKDIIAMQGRFHFYEGYTMQEITYPIRVMRELGIETLIISNACGSMNPNINKADIMIIDDHINLLGSNPLIGLNDSYFGPRFVDMCRPYDPGLIKLVEDIASENSITIHKGVYAAMTGPSLETRAEYRFLRAIGADVIGMSTVPETIVAVQSGIKVMGLSIITDECYPDTLQPTHIDEIIATAKKAEPNLNVLVKNLIARI